MAEDFFKKKKTISFEVDVDGEKSIKTVRDLKNELDSLRQKAEGMDVTSSEFKKISSEISKSDGQLKKLNKSFESLDPDARAGELGKLAGGLGAIGTAAALAFQGNEDAEKFFETFAKGLAITNAAKGGIEAYTSSQKLLTDSLKNGGIAAKVAAAAQSAYSTIVGASTGALKAFRIALASTGIGALVVGLGLLIANFDSVTKFITKAVDKFRNMGTAIKILLPPITLLIAAYDGVVAVLQKLGIVDDEQTIAAKKNVQERIENQEKERQVMGDKYDFEIAKAKAAGKNTFELEQEKRKAFIESAKIQMQLMLEQVKLNGELTDEQREKMENLKNETIKIAKEMTVARIAENKRVVEEEKKNYDEWRKIQEEKAKEEKKNYDEWRKIQEEKAKLERSEFDELINIRNEIAGDELAIERKKWDDKIKLTKEKYGKESELIKALEFQKQESLEKIQKEIDNKKAEESLKNLELQNKIEIQKLIEKNASEEEIKKAEEEKELEELIFKRENDLISLKEFELAKLEIKNKFKQQEQEQEKEEEETKIQRNIRELELERNKLQKSQELTATAFSVMDAFGSQDEKNKKQRAEREFNIQKGLQVSIATISGIQSTLAAYENGMKNPVPLLGPATGAIYAAVAGITAAANIKKIASTKFNSGGSNSSTPTSATPTSSSATPAIPNVSQLYPTESFSSENENVGSEIGERQTTIKAYITQNEIEQNDKQSTETKRRSQII